MTITKEILESHPVKNLKAEIRKVKKSFDYSKLKKPELIELMLKPENKDFFKHIKMFEKPAPKKGKDRLMAKLDKIKKDLERIGKYDELKKKIEDGTLSGKKADDEIKQAIDEAKQTPKTYSMLPRVYHNKFYGIPIITIYKKLVHFYLRF